MTGHKKDNSRQIGPRPFFAGKLAPEMFFAGKLVPEIFFRENWSQKCFLQANWPQKCFFAGKFVDIKLVGKYVKNESVQCTNTAIQIH